MVQIPLTKGKYAIVDDADFELLAQYNWCFHNGYAARRLPKHPSRLLYMHRVILSASKGKQVDHINMNGLDNRRSNLRIASKSENMQNRPKQSNNTSGFKGVSLDKRKRFKKWRANIAINGKNIGLGYFLSKEEAATAYKKAVGMYHKQFARITI